MNIHVTEQAEAILKEKLAHKPGIIRLIYDTEGCGCAVNGVPGLRIIEEVATMDVPIHTDSTLSFAIHQKHGIFFEEHLKLSTTPDSCSFRLEGREQSYGTHVQLIDIR
ncbi:hypothetical protein JCM10914A_41080 [Paenibacillus sp. JCM 10914]|uniref:iron-sulfur cluster biosynthesis family protein n=1 Tax=Paenibacillus sp. JCM 10914 TaxID=1236974 RepID=UPI0003CC460C|nr:iron-sulfur cluster biosynthesis family protein [Paenibacillus sp. JCM 10914]GAE05323.1 hypothetical protein JCM10914_1419 [Paenibacillus sp. JCM 10914]